MSKPDNSHTGGSVDQEEKALRDFFRSAGHVPAPENLSARVIAQIKSEEKTALSPVRPLIPNAVWAVLGILMMATFIYTFSLPSQDGHSLVGDWFGHSQLPSFEIKLPELFSVFQHVPRSLALVLPIILLQLYFIKNFYEGRYSR